MAVTNTQNYYNQQKQKVQQAQPYNGLAGVSQNTAQQLGQLQQGYAPSEQVMQAQQKLQQVQNQKPGQFQSKYTPQLDSILEQIQNPQEFKYEFEGDNLFKAYRDMYTQMGKQASLDAQGQAAGLTGGYGNSYGQQVGQQAYQQNLIPLYDRGMDLRDRAYGEYRDMMGDKQTAYQLMSDRENAEYGRYRDTVSDWQTAEQQAYDRYKEMGESDFNKYQVMLNYYQGLAELENKDFRDEQARQETIRQFNETMAENIREFDEELAEKIRSNKATEDYNNRSLEETKRSNLATEDYNNRALDETIRSNKVNEDIEWAKIDAQYGDHDSGGSSSSGSGGSGGGGGDDENAGGNNDNNQDYTYRKNANEYVNKFSNLNLNTPATSSQNGIFSNVAKTVANTAKIATTSLEEAEKIARKNGWLLE